jgi:hypothetical protein
MNGAVPCNKSVPDRPAKGQTAAASRAAPTDGCAAPSGACALAPRLSGHRLTPMGQSAKNDPLVGLRDTGRGCLLPFPENTGFARHFGRAGSRPSKTRLRDSHFRAIPYGFGMGIELRLRRDGHGARLYLHIAESP